MHKLICVYVCIWIRLSFWGPHLNQLLKARLPCREMVGVGGVSALSLVAGPAAVALFAVLGLTQVNQFPNQLSARPILFQKAASTL